MTYSLPFL
jgi:hypothetical protein